MSQVLPTQHGSAPHEAPSPESPPYEAPSPRRRTEQTRWLLIGGSVAGPLFLLVAAGQVLTRDGFDLGRHPLSLLSVGQHGWIQILNFVVAGVLSVGFAVALRLVVHPGRAG